MSLTPDKNEPILIELVEVPGEEEVSLSSVNVAEKSVEALDNAMQTIKYIAQHAVAMVDELEVPNRPTQVEMEFGVKLDVEANAWIAKARGEGNILIRLTWGNSG